MAFVFTVETGTGTHSSANSYPSVAEADDYLEPDTARYTIWNALTTTQKQYLLALGTRNLNVYSVFEGTKTVATSPMPFPRTGVTDKEGCTIGANVIPNELKFAAIELGYLLNTLDLTELPATEGIKKIVVDVIEIEFQSGENESGVTPRTIPSIINALLNGIGFFAKGSRRQSAKIIRS